MPQKLYLTYAIAIIALFSWANWNGYELGDDAASTWSQQSANHFHK